MMKFQSNQTLINVNLDERHIAIFFANNSTVIVNINFYIIGKSKHQYLTKNVRLVEGVIWKTPVEVNCGERLKTNNSLCKPF
jgi:hypothetical protein